MKRARPTGLAQSQHNKYKQKSSIKQTSHNNQTFTKITKNENTLFKTHPTYSLKNNTNTKCKHKSKTPLPPSNQTNTLNSNIHHTTSNKILKYINKSKKTSNPINRPSP